MSVFLFLEKVSEEKAKVMCIHNMPDMLSEAEKKNGVLIDFYPEPEHQNGKIALPYWNYEAQELFFEYVDEPQNGNQVTNAAQMEEIEKLQKDSLAITEMLAVALEENKALKIQLLEQEQAIAELSVFVGSLV